MMKQLIQTDLLSTADYERQREQFRSQIIALKQRRRISVGPLITLIFENRETLRFQTQEMIRVEHSRVRRLAPTSYADGAPSRVPRQGACSWEHARRVAL